MIRLLSLVLLTVLFAGCGASPWGFPHGYPPEALTAYQRVAVQRDHVELAGVRVLPDGLLVDLVADVESARGLQGLSILAGSWSVRSKPRDLLEVRDTSDRPVALYPQRRGVIDTPLALVAFMLHGPFGQYPLPPREILGESEGRSKVVQTCVFRSSRIPNPGTFRARFLPGALDDLEKHQLGADQQWREVEAIKVSRERPKPRGPAPPYSNTTG